MRYSAVERVNPVVSENDFVTRNVRKKRQFLKPLLKKLDVVDMAIVVVTIGVLVSLGFVIASLVHALSGVSSAVNAISAIGL